MNVKNLSEQLGVPESEYIDLVRLFIQTSSVYLEKLRSAVSNKAGAEASTIAHSLKGAALNMRFDVFLDTTAALEKAIQNGQWQAADRLIRQLSELLKDIEWATS